MIVKKMSRAPAAALALGAMATALGGSPANATDKETWASGGQCRGNYNHGATFFIMDADGSDSDYCYILYNWSAGGGGRINHPQDYGVGNWYQYDVNGTPGSRSVDWRVCKERENDPDICSAWVHDFVRK